MYPFINILGRDIGMYGIMLMLGVGVAAAVLCLLCKYKKPQTIVWWDAIFVSVFAFLGGLAGAVLLRPIMKLPDIFINWSAVYSKMSLFEIVSGLFGEIVFYGGLIGGAITVIICTKKFLGKPVLLITDLLAPGIALAHAFGRVGCFFGGCCYGMQVHPSHPLAIRYPEVSLAAPPNVPLLAIPLIEAFCLLIISAILVTFYIKSNKTGICTGLYFVLYATLRFTIEFFRGDLIRGVYGPFSTSQYISMGFFAIGVYLLIRQLNKNRLQPQSPS